MDGAIEKTNKLLKEYHGLFDKAEEYGVEESIRSRVQRYGLVTVENLRRDIPPISEIYSGWIKSKTYAPQLP